jgi:hypothetical protein
VLDGLQLVAVACQTRIGYLETGEPGGTQTPWLVRSRT